MERNCGHVHIAWQSEPPPVFPNSCAPSTTTSLTHNTTRTFLSRVTTLNSTHLTSYARKKHATEDAPTTAPFVNDTFLIPSLHLQFYQYSPHHVRVLNRVASGGSITAGRAA
jgi:hypothetical protein